MKSGAFVLALAMVLFSVAVSQADAPIIGEDKVTYRVSLENSGDLYQIAKAHNIYESGECKKIERRDAPDGTWMEFDVTYDPLTFIASSYTYKEYDGKHTYTTKAVINDSTTEFTITDETGKTWNRSLKRKEGAPPLFDPVYTYYFGSMLGKGVSSGTIQMIITHDNGFDDYLMDWKVLGTETVDVG